MENVLEKCSNINSSELCEASKNAFQTMNLSEIGIYNPAEEIDDLIQSAVSILTFFEEKGIVTWSIYKIKYNYQLEAVLSSTHCNIIL